VPRQLSAIGVSYGETKSGSGSKVIYRRYVNIAAAASRSARRKTREFHVGAVAARGSVIGKQVSGMCAVNTISGQSGGSGVDRVS